MKNIPQQQKLLLSILGMIISYANLKSIKIRNIINAGPTVLIENGVILDKTLKKSRLTVNDIMMRLGKKNKENFGLQ